jgi:predicted membrane channel-forming protein YqfA (hemolysin III family)
MEKNLTVRIFKIISLVLILGAVIGIVFVWTQSETEMRENVGLQNRILNPYFTVAYIALGLCVVLALLFPIINIITQPKNAIRVLIGLGVLVLVGVIAYVISSNEFTDLQLRFYKISETGSRQIGAALIATYFIAGASVLAILYAEVSNLIKK